MKNRVTLLLIAVATGIFISVSKGEESPQSPVRTFKGQAREPGTATILYSEKYDVEFRGGAPLLAKTEYRSASGDLIAERTLDFSRYPFKPDYRLVDARDGYEEGAEVKDSRNGEAELRLFTRVNRDKKLREKILRVPEPCVIDGGFNTFVKAHWDDLTGGKRVAFNFVAPNKLDYFAFEAVPVPREPDSPDTRTFLIRPENAALRLLVSPIRVTYDVATRRMTRYLGISNINDADGKSFKIRLDYPALGP